MNPSHKRNGNSNPDRHGKTLRRTVGRLIIGGCLILAVTGCSGFQLSRRVPVPAGPDPYQQALQQALLRQHVGQLKDAAAGYRLGRYDVIEIHVFEYDKMNTLTRVGENGCISLPPLGEIKVTGLTERELESVLQNQLRGNYLQDPHVTVMVKEPHAMEVAIVGEVTKPGRFSMLGEKCLLDLMAEAGGMTVRAGNVAYVVRLDNGNTSGASPTLPTSASLAGDPAGLNPGATSIRIDLDGLLIRGEERWNIPLKSGDLINIPEAGWVHVTGHGVEKPGTYPLTRTAKTLVQVVDEAGGLKWEARRKVYILRKEESGKENMSSVDYPTVVKDSRNDIPMCSGDTVITDRTLGKGVLASIGRGIETLVHVGIYGSVPIFSPK